MDACLEAEARLRELLRNHPQAKERLFPVGGDQRARLSVALDTLGDSSLALASFRREGFLASHGRDAQDLGDGYLGVYGLFQALFLHQNAINELWRLFTSESIDFAKWPAFKRLRTWRNDITGHPLDRSDGSRTAISRVTLSRSGFEVVTYSKGQELPDITPIDLQLLLDGYSAEASSLLSLIETRVSTALQATELL